MKAFWLVVFIIVVIGGGLLYFAQSTYNNSNGGKIGVGGTIPTIVRRGSSQISQALSQIGVKSFTVEGGNYYFNPKEIRVNKGDTVKINFKNLEGYHTFVIDNYNVSMGPINQGITKSAEFKADKTGTFEYYCNIDGHRMMGMTGKLIVE